MNDQNKISERILRLPEVIERTGLKRSTIYELIKLKKFVRPISLGARSVGWVEREIDEWINAKLSDRDRDVEIN